VYPSRKDPLRASFQGGVSNLGIKFIPKLISYRVKICPKDIPLILSFLSIPNMQGLVYLTIEEYLILVKYSLLAYLP
jgi:hypothetical protein